MDVNSFCLDADLLERNCDVLYKDACVRSGFDIAIDGDDDCSKILRFGPDLSGNAPECESYSAAVDIYQSTLEGICGE